MTKFLPLLGEDKGLACIHGFASVKNKQIVQEKKKENLGIWLMI